MVIRKGGKGAVRLPKILVLAGVRTCAAVAREVTAASLSLAIWRWTGRAWLWHPPRQLGGAQATAPRQGGWWAGRGVTGEGGHGMGGEGGGAQWPTAPILSQYAVNLPPFFCVPTQ